MNCLEELDFGNLCKWDNVTCKIVYWYVTEKFKIKFMGSKGKYEILGDFNITYIHE